MNESDDEDDCDDFVLLQDDVYDARDDDLKLIRDDPQQRHGLQYPLVRCMAWSQDEDSDHSSGHDVLNSPSRINDHVNIQSLIASICTISAPTIAEVPVRHHNGRGNVVWQQELASFGDRYTIAKQEEKQ
jgi:hypothetical protein